jgi:hypothetical protein
VRAQRRRLPAESEAVGRRGKTEEGERKEEEGADADVRGPRSERERKGREPARSSAGRKREWAGCWAVRGGEKRGKELGLGLGKEREGEGEGFGPAGWAPSFSFSFSTLTNSNNST